MAKDKETPVGNSQTIAVSLDQHDSVSWKWLSNGEEQEPPFASDEVVLRTLADYDFLKGLIEDNLKGDLKREASRRLGKALVDSFIEIETGSIKNRKTNHLAQAKRFVGGMLTQSARISYVVSALTMALLLSVFFLVLIGPLSEWPQEKLRMSAIYGGLGGCLGAFLSVLSRNRTLRLDPWLPRKLILTQGAFRVFLGFLFGVTIAILIRTQILFVIEVPEPEDSWLKFRAALLTMGAIAGFSERLIPDLFSKMSESLGIGSES